LAVHSLFFCFFFFFFLSFSSQLIVTESTLHPGDCSAQAVFPVAENRKRAVALRHAAGIAALCPVHGNDRSTLVEPEQ
jgi:hypothetical protein